MMQLASKRRRDSHQSDAILSGMAAQKNPLGPTGNTVRENIKRLREAHNLTYAELSRRLEKAGRGIPTLGLSRIEEGERRVDSDDLMALAAVLGVNPNALLLPLSPGPSDLVDVTGAHRQLRAEEAWGWARGEEPLVTPGQEYKPGTFRETVNPPWVLAQMDRDLAVKDHFFGAQWVTEEQREDSPPDGTD